jgi:hypothetical protein
MYDLKKVAAGGGLDTPGVKKILPVFCALLYDLSKIQYRICSQIILCDWVFHENRPGGSHNPLGSVNTFHSYGPHVSFRPDEIQYEGSERNVIEHLRVSRK